MTFNKKILHILVVLSMLFLSLCVYLTYFQMFKSADMVSSPYNLPRLRQQEDKVLRGSIYDRNGTVLAESVREEDQEFQTRKYPYGSLYSHVIGYNSYTYGKNQLELYYNNYMSGSDGMGEVINMGNALTGGTRKGADIRLTVDHKLQKIASDGIGNRRGAAIAIDPRTGEVLAMVSKPDFDPNEDTLVTNWEDLNQREDSPLYARATSGLYNPGSTFKTVIATAAFENGMGDVSYNDEGSVIIDGKKFSNSHGASYGEIELKKAFAVSSNVVFSQLAVELGENNVRNMASRFQIGKSVDFDLPLKDSKFGYSDSMSKTEVAAVGIGQGKLQVTPMNMALVAAAVANDGVMMKPYLVDQITAPNGLSIRSSSPTVLENVCSAGTANEVTELMKECVASGTGRNAKMSGITVAGKTGTAQNETGKDHAWFICFAPADHPTIAIAVMLESDGTGGGSTCAPIAKNMMEYWLRK